MFFAPSEERAGGGEGSQLSENTNGGKRLAPGENKPVNKTWLLILAGVLAVVICVYLALCAYAHRDAFWKNTSVGGVDISGLTTAQAAERLNTELPKNWEGKTLALTGPKGERLSIETDGLVEPEDLNADLGRAAYGGHGKDANFLGLGVWYLAQNITREDVAVAPALAYTAQGGQRVEELLTQAAREWNVSGKDTVCRYGQDAITLVKGRTDVKVQADHTRNAIWTRRPGRSSPRSPGRALTCRRPGPPWTRRRRERSSGWRLTLPSPAPPPRSWRPFSSGIFWARRPPGSPAPPTAA